jgi:methionyl-tRNA formyltransferase
LIVVAGKNDIAVHGLKLALQYFNRSDIIAVVNANDTGVDDWQRSYFKFASEAGVKIISLKELYCRDDIRLFLSLEFDKIVSTDNLKTERIYNIHFSVLPKYKGMYTSIWPILFGDDFSGVTLHEIDCGIDTGKIVAQKTFPLVDSDRSQDCYKKYIKYSKELLSENFHRLVSIEKASSERQLSERSSYFSKNTIDFSELNIDFKNTAWKIKRQIYAFSFRPYQLMKFNGRSVSNALITEDKSVLKPGQIVQEFFNKVVISTVDYDIQLIFDNITEVLLGIPSMSLADFESSIDKMLGVNDRNEKGWSPIIVAAYKGRVDIIDFLLTHGADINDVNYKGTTVLMYAKTYALEENDSDIVRYLIKSGADVNQLDYSGKSIFDYTSESEAVFLGLK